MVNDGEVSPLKIKKETIYQRDQVTYISDKVGANLRSVNPAANEWGGQIGLHRISNPDPDNIAVSLHREQLPIRYA